MAFFFLILPMLASSFIHSFNLYVSNTFLALQKVSLSRSLQLSKEARHRTDKKCDQCSGGELERLLEKVMWKTPSLPQKRAFKLRPEGYGSTSWPLEASFLGVRGQEQEESQWSAGTEEMLACWP